ncbi:MAG: DUF4124 domain-containing protein [Deltaproteobacteria bacterium]|nr:DUF4124 domain-containing protein [Deltaproteobacteria bacterium]
MVRALLVLSGLLLLGASPSRAQVIYRWVDDSGEVHYTDDKSSVPKDRQRSAVVTRGDELGIAAATPEPASETTPLQKEEAADRAAQQAALKIAQEQAEEEAEVQAEKEWRQRFRDVHGQIERLERQVEADRKAVEDPNAAGIPLGRLDAHGAFISNPHLEEIKRRLADSEQELAKAREDLADLEREAARKAIPLHWRR